MCSNEKHILLIYWAQQRRLWVFEHVYLKPFDKYFIAARCVFTSSCFENKHKAVAKLGRQTLDWKTFWLPRVLNCSTVQTRPKLIKPIRVNMIVIWTKVDITIAVCQMINYLWSTNSLINLETGFIDIFLFQSHGLAFPESRAYFIQFLKDF